MKVTNFFLDFILLGSILLGSIFLLIYLYNEHLFISLINLMKTNESIPNNYLIPFGIILIYIFGIFYSQCIDVHLQRFRKLYRLNEVKAKENIFSNKFNKTYHQCLQKVILNSQSAYDYLSYRRSIIRIIRTLFFSAFLILVLYPLISLISIIFFKIKVEFSVKNIIIYIVIMIFAIFLRRRFIKLSIGYYDAITNFYALL